MAEAHDLYRMEVEVFKSMVWDPFHIVAVIVQLQPERCHLRHHLAGIQLPGGAMQPSKLCPRVLGVHRVHFRLHLCRVDRPGCTAAEERDICRMEFEVFRSVAQGLFYILVVAVSAAESKITADTSSLEAAEASSAA